MPSAAEILSLVEYSNFTIFFTPIEFVFESLYKWRAVFENLIDADLCFGFEEC